MRDLEKISDTELNKRLDAVSASIRRNKKTGGDTTPTEVELCYLQREEEVRAIRKEKHVEYLKEIEKAIQEEREAMRDYLDEE